ncbi:hypothetical protein TNCV_4458961 [Trichonephila clavipes]|nr:hypothetical protein TNCV_4458961 [Trichonephila clavipes]
MAVDANVGDWGCQRLESPRRIAKWGDEAPIWRRTERSVGVSYLLGKRVEEQRLFDARRYLVCESEGPPERTVGPQQPSGHNRELVVRIISVESWVRVPMPLKIRCVEQLISVETQHIGVV